MHSLHGWPKQFDFGQAKLRVVYVHGLFVYVVYVGYLSGGHVKGTCGVCPQKDFAKFFLSVLKLSY